MKYTRYNLKRKKKDGITLTIIAFGTLILCFLMGALIFSFSGSVNNVNKNLSPIKNQSIDVVNKNLSSTKNQNPNLANKSLSSVKNQNGNVANSNKEPITYIAIQGGLFKVKKNADATINILSGYGNPFIITEQDKTKRVIFGIYSEEEAINQMKILSDKNIANSELTYKIPQSDLCDEEIIEIINGNLQIISTASGTDVSSVKSDSFKKWCLALKNVDNNSKNISTLKELKNNIKDLPKEISKDKISGLYIHIYDTLKKFIVKTAPIA